MEKNFVFVISGRVFEGDEYIEEMRIPVAVKGTSYEEARAVALEMAQSISRGYNESILQFYYRICSK